VTAWTFATVMLAAAILLWMAADSLCLAAFVLFLLGIAKGLQDDETR
jgi:hypothetical protein